MAADFDKLKKTAGHAIDSLAEELFRLNQELWKKPELSFEEKHAHDTLTKYLEEKGFKVSRHYTLHTAFRAVSGECDEGLTVGVMCEYDALPAVGHACGHNLIAEAGVAAGIGEKTTAFYQLRAPVSNFEKWRHGLKFSKLLIICLKDNFGELSSEIVLKLFENL